MIHRLSRPFDRLRPAPFADPSAAMFRRIRWGLTAWYTVVLALTLLVLGIILYQEESDRLLGPVDSELQTSAQNIAGAWQALPDAPCPVRVMGGEQGLLWACYDQNGRLLAADPQVRDFPRFTDSSVLTNALQAGTATDTIDSRTVVGALLRYAVRVSDPQTGSVLGLVEVGAPVGDRIRALDTLLTLLLVCGVPALLLAAGSGLFLASRSLRPVHLAYERQRDFIADASHELRTPLTMVRADAEVLLRDRQALAPDQALILEDIVTEVAHMGSLATNMLDLARLDAGRLRIEDEVVDLAAVGHDVARRAGPLADEREVRMRVEDGEPILVIGDPLLIEHVALILTDNAIKYNRPGGEVVLRTRRQGDQAVLQVQDTGIGIAAEDMPHLGERFYRVDKARSREAGGAGLGVSIAQAIAAQHGGSLRFTSQVDEGTTATLSLPAAGTDDRRMEAK